MEIVPKLRSVPGQFKPHVEALEHAVERILIMTPLGDRREEFARSLKVNDEVHVPKLGAICRVVRINKGKRRLTVRSEGIEAEIGFEDISWAPPAAGGAT